MQHALHGANHLRGATRALRLDFSVPPHCPVNAGHTFGFHRKAPGCPRLPAAGSFQPKTSSLSCGLTHALPILACPVILAGFPAVVNVGISPFCDVSSQGRVTFLHRTFAAPRNRSAVPFLLRQSGKNQSADPCSPAHSCCRRSISYGNNSVPSPCPGSFS